MRSLPLGIILMFLIFIVEIKTGSLGGTAAYLLILLYTLWRLRTSRYLMVLGTISSLFLGSAFILPFFTSEYNSVTVINRGLSLAVVWLAVYFTFRFRKLYDEQRQKADELKALFENANEGILFSTQDGLITMTNPFLEKMFGYEPGDLVGRDICILIPDKYHDNHVHHLNAFVGKPERKPMDRELWARHKNGLEFPVDINLSHFYNNKQLTIIAFIIDVTERRRHQQMDAKNLSNIKNSNLILEEKVRLRTQELELANYEIKKSQYLYKAMAHNFPDGIIGILDKEMKYLLVDGKDLQVLDSKEESAIGNDLFDNIHNAIFHYAEGSLKKVYSGESIVFDIEVDKKYYNVSSVPIPNTKNEINEILVVIKNISTQKKLEKDLINMLEKEKELNKLKSRFVTTASHEFRTPLTTILSSTFLLENYTEVQLAKDKQKHLDRIKRSVHGLTELLNDFLSLGKLEEGKIKVIYDEVNLHEFVDEFSKEISLLKKPNQDFEVTYEVNQDYIIGDHNLIRNILMNLVSNAIKYSPDPSTIKLNFSNVNQQLIIKIIDQGIGIPEEESKHIFKRFFRAHNVAQIEGTGLGLNIVKKYVKLLKGTIDFSSEVNKGTTFTVKLPLISNQQETLTKHLNI